MRAITISRKELCGFDFLSDKKSAENVIEISRKGLCGYDYLGDKQISDEMIDFQIVHQWWG